MADFEVDLRREMVAAARVVRGSNPGVYRHINVFDLAAPFIDAAASFLRPLHAELSRLAEAPVPEGDYKEARWLGSPIAVLQERVEHHTRTVLDDGQAEDILRALDALMEPEQQFDPIAEPPPEGGALDFAMRSVVRDLHNGSLGTDAPDQFWVNSLRGYLHNRVILDGLASSAPHDELVAVRDSVTRVCAVVVSSLYEHLRADRTPAPSPDIREVPLSEASEGDKVARLGTVAHTFAGGAAITWDGAGTPENYSWRAAGFTVTRPVSPLPDKPGAAGTATVRGTADVGVFRTDEDTGPLHWTSAVLVNGHRWHEDSHLSDYVPLDGQEP